MTVEHKNVIELVKARDLPSSVIFKKIESVDQKMQGSTVVTSKIQIGSSRSNQHFSYETYQHGNKEKDSVAATFTRHKNQLWI